MNKEYKIKLDLNKRLYNKKMVFNQFDENVNDFYVEVTKNNEVVKDLDKSIITLVAIKPNGEVDAQFIETKDGQIYADLKPSMCDLIGNYQAKAMIVLEGEIVTTDIITYSVNEDKIISKLNDDIVSDERFEVLNDMLSRLSTIEINEANRENNFNEIKEQFKVIKNNHNELVTTQTDKKVIELLDPVIERVDNKINQVNNKISEVNEFVEAKEAEIDKNLDENTKKINDKIIDIEYKTLINTNKVDVAISKIPPKSELIGPQGKQGPIGPQGVKGDTPSITHLETTVSNKVNEIETRFNTLTSKQQQDAEVIDARVDFKGVVFDSLKERIDNTDKILRDSTVSTVTTESDFTTVEETSNGYFEDVKLEGKTLVNLVKNGNIPKILGVGNATHAKFLYNRPLELNKVYTLIAKVSNINETGDNRPTISYNSGKNGSGMRFNNGINTTVFENKTSITDSNEVWVFYTASSSITSTDPQIDYIYILEGDHTQNPPNFFEGLKSVGDGVDEVSVESVNENLFDATLDTQTKNGVTFSYDDATGEVVLNGTCTSDNTCVFLKYHTKFIEGNTYYLRIFGTTTNSPLAYVRVYDDNYVGNNIVTTSIGPSIYTSSSSRKMVNTSIRVDKGATFNNFRFKVQLTANEDRTEYTPHQSNKKPLLYYNPTSETWEKLILRQWDSIEKHSDSKYYYHKRSEEVAYTSGDEVIENYITDLINTVKPLAQEEVYECTNIDLITYNGETNYIVNCGAIVPKTTLKVHSNISNVVKILQEKVSLLESNIKASQEVQDMMILETDMRMLDIELALMEFMPMKLNLGGNDMLRSATYFNFLKNHIVNETYSKEYLENVMNKYLTTKRLTQEEYDELYKLLYPPVYDIELPIEY